MRIWSLQMARNVKTGTGQELKSGRRLILHLSLAAALIVTGLSWMKPHATAAVAERVVPFSGDYLAGRFADRLRDNENAVGYFTKALKADPKNRAILERTLLLYVATGEMRSAIGVARQIITYKPAHRAARLVLGLNDFRHARYRSARSHFAKSNDVPLAQLTSTVLTAWSYLGQRKHTQALAALEKAAGNDALKTFYSYHRALLTDIVGTPKRAQRAYETAYKDNGGSLRVVQAYGRFLERQKRHGAALRIYSTFLEKNPTHALILAAQKRAKSGRVPSRLISDAKGGAAEVLFGIASVLSDEAGIDIPLRFARLALYMKPKFVLARILTGDIYGETKRYEKAIQAYRTVPNSSPLKRNAEIQMAANLNSLKKEDEARIKLQNVIERHPNDYEPVVVLADMLRGHSKFKQAAKYYSQAVDLVDKFERRHWLLFYHRGISYERSKQWPLAESDFKKALELFPDQPSVLNYLGYSWVEQRQNLQLAMKMIAKAVELRSGDGYIVDSLGWAHYQLGQYDEAVKLLERAVDLRPDDPVINDHLGDAYWHVGRKLEARFQWSHARDLKPEPDVLKIILKKLEVGLGNTDKKSGVPNKPVEN